MDILLYVTELLQTRKAVGIIGLGTLYKKKSPGKYDVVQHAFVPPSYALAFTTELKEREELANFISEKRNISVDSANYYISEFAEKIQAQLAEVQEADLSPIGKFKLVNDQLVLFAETESNFGNEFYGLPTLNELSGPTNETSTEQPTAAEENTAISDLGQQETQQEEQTTEIEETTDPIESIIEENKLEEENPGQESGEEVEEKELDEQPVYDEIAEVEQPVVEAPVANEEQEEEKPVSPSESETPVTEIPAPPPPIVNYNYLEDGDDDDDNDGRPSKFFRILIKTIIVLILIVVAGAVTYFFFPGWFDSMLKKTSQIETENSMTVHPGDTSLVPIDSAVKGDTLAKNNALINLVKDSNAVDTNKIISYEVIGSAEKSQKRIDHVISTMQKRGIPAKALQNLPGRLTKISLGSFTDYNVAKAYQDSLKIKLKNPQIYIQSIKPKK